MKAVFTVMGFAAGLLVLAAATEAALRRRIRRSRRYRVWLPFLRLEFHPDPRIFPGLERRVRFAINREGERGEEPPAAHPGLFRVLVAGGSAAECALLDQLTSWPGALPGILEGFRPVVGREGIRVHVGNIGRSGIASAHLRFIFRNLLPGHSPLSSIVVMVGGNDVWDWLRCGAPAAYTPPRFRWPTPVSFIPGGVLAGARKRRPCTTPSRKSAGAGSAR